jgi:curli production assembly/transport component CsgG
MRFRLVLAVAVAVMAAACDTVPRPPVKSVQPFFPPKTASQKMLEALPPPDHPIAVAVYGFADETGQFKPSNQGQTLSRAISQGGATMLVSSLQSAGQRRWFTVVEREGFKDLLNERAVIGEMRARYLGEKSVNAQALPALLFAGVILEGGVVGYDTSTHTGGVGAALLGISLDAKWQQDTVTVYLRAVSVKTGEVLSSVRVSKTITSAQVDADVFKYIDYDKILQSDNGWSMNEPGQLALQQAIDKAVYALVLEGSDQKLWGFADAAKAWPEVWRYRQEREGLHAGPPPAPPTPSPSGAKG